MDIIGAVDSLSGFVSAILTLVYVIATIWILIKNGQVVKEMRRAREQQLKANMVATFESRRKGLMCFVLRNLGGSAVNGLSVDISPDFVNCLDEERAATFRKLKNASLTIIPNQEVIYVAGGPQAFKKLAEAQLKGTISYTDVFGKRWSENFCIEIASYKGALLYGPGLDELTATIDRGLRAIAMGVGSDVTGTVGLIEDATAPPEYSP